MKRINICNEIGANMFIPESMPLEVVPKIKRQKFKCFHRQCLRMVLQGKMESYHPCIKQSLHVLTRWNAFVTQTFVCHCFSRAEMVLRKQAVQICNLHDWSQKALNWQRRKSKPENCIIFCWKWNIFSNNILIDGTGLWIDNACA